MSIASLDKAEITVITGRADKQVRFNVTCEGALFRGGKAIAALKDTASQIMLAKAQAGKYRAVVEALEAAFSTITRQYRTKNKLTDPLWLNKATFEPYAQHCASFVPKNGKPYTAKQEKARALIEALRDAGVLSPTLLVEEPVTPPGALLAQTWTVAPSVVTELEPEVEPEVEPELVD